MNELEELREYIRFKKHTFVDKVDYRSHDDTVVLYIPKDKVGSVAKNGMTSRRQIKFLEKQIKAKFGREVSTIFIQSEEDKSLESGLLSILKFRFNTDIESLHLWRNEEGICLDVTVCTTEESLINEIEDLLKKIIRNNLVSIHWITSKFRKPSLSSLLRVIKLNQPISITKIMKILEKKYTVSELWLRSRLDQARKKGFIRWVKENGCYELTTKGLEAVPAGARRSSSDVDRALAMRKKKW